jgi:hypothetical protein
MSEPVDPRNPISRATSRMETDEVLALWTRTARQADLNAVHKALFAMLDGSLFHTYRVVEDVQLPNELYVIVKDDLVLKLRVHDINDISSFDIIAIGPRDHFSTQDGQPSQ